MGPAFAWAMAGAASAHQAATATREDTSQQRAGRTRRTSAEPRRAQQGASASPAAAPAAGDSLSRLQQLAVASPQVAQLQRLQALAHASPQVARLQALADRHYAPVAQLAGGPEEEEPVQGQFATAELPPQLQQAPLVNNTGLPDQLKSGIESLSGLSMDDVRVHYNSSQPSQLNALAYAQGSDIHLAPRQERHLPHEAWHVVQQAQGRVRPTLQLKDGVPVNDDVGLEREADVMGERALEGGHRVVEAHRSVSIPTETAQRIDYDATNSPELNVANNDSAPLAKSRGSAQRGGNEIQRIADQRPEAALQRQVQAWGDGSERVGQLRAWQRVADERGRQKARPDSGAQKARPDFGIHAIKLNIQSTRSTGRHSGNSQEQRADKGTAGSTVSNLITRTEGQNAVNKDAFGMVSPTHKTTVATARKTENDLVVSLSHNTNLDVSFGNTRVIDVGTKDTLKSIKKKNWAQAKQDLTPDDAGKPPRTEHYSAQYLRDHENNHVVESEAATLRGIATARTNLQNHTISNDDFQNRGVDDLAEPIRKKTEEVIRDTDYKDYMGVDWGLSLPHASRPGEIRTYAKGKADYQALADKIDAHAKQAGWQGNGQPRPNSKKNADINAEKKRGKKYSG